MSKSSLTAKQTAVVEYYCNPGSESFNNWCESYKRANYSLCTGWKHNAIKLLHIDYIQAGIADYRAKTTAKLDHNRDRAIDLLNQNIAWLTPKAETGDIPAVQALTAVIRELDAISNLHRATVVSEAVRPQSDPAEAQALKDLARAYKLKLVKPMAKNIS